MRLRIELNDQSFVVDDQALAPYRAELRGPKVARTRVAYAAAHVAFLPGYADLDHSLERPGSPAEIAEAIDWSTTFELRRFLSRQGFGIAEAMDTAQRFSLGWPAAEQLIEGCGRLELPGGFVAGASTDHLSGAASKRELASGVLWQIDRIRRNGGLPLVLPLPWLSQSGATEDDYVAVYAEIVRGASGPILLHWLGEAFLPELAGYFPGESFRRILELDPGTVRGIKLSLLDPQRELELRRELRGRGQAVFTGDDFHFTDLIRGGDPGMEEDIAPVGEVLDLDGQRLPLGDFSHALLGIFDAIAEPASLALQFLDRGNRARYEELMRPCEELSRWIFRAPTRHYKVGLAWLSWLNGRQVNPMLAQHEERARSLPELVRTAALAAEARVLVDPLRAAAVLEAEGAQIEPLDRT